MTFGCSENVHYSMIGTMLRFECFGLIEAMITSPHAGWFGQCLLWVVESKKGAMHIAPFPWSIKSDCQMTIGKNVLLTGFKFGPKAGTGAQVA